MRSRSGASAVASAETQESLEDWSVLSSAGQLRGRFGPISWDLPTFPFVDMAPKKSALRWPESLANVNAIKRSLRAWFGCTCNAHASCIRNLMWMLPKNAQSPSGIHVARLAVRRRALAMFAPRLDPFRGLGTPSGRDLFKPSCHAVSVA